MASSSFATASWFSIDVVVCAIDRFLAAALVAAPLAPGCCARAALMRNAASSVEMICVFMSFLFVEVTEILAAGREVENLAASGLQPRIRGGGERFQIFAQGEIIGALLF